MWIVTERDELLYESESLDDVTKFVLNLLDSRKSSDCITSVKITEIHEDMLEDSK